MQKKFLSYFIILSAVFFCSNVHAQTNFFTSGVSDSLVNDFYKMNKKATVFATVSFPDNSFGAALLLHNNVNKISYYFQASSNIVQNKTVVGYEIDGTGQEQKSVPYTLFKLNMGLGHAIKKNTILFASAGIVSQYSEYVNQPYAAYNYTDIPFGMNMNLGIGIVYSTESNISLMGAVQSFENNLLFGVGYTF